MNRRATGPRCFVKRKTQDGCRASAIAITEEKFGTELLPDGQVVPMLGYMPSPGERLSMLSKGIPMREGEIPSVLTEQQWIMQGFPPISDEPVSLAFGTETYQFRVDGFDLVIEERGKNSAKQSVPLFIDPDRRCNDPGNGLLRRDVALFWTGDLDGNGRADFLVWASAYRSCALAILRWDPEHFLILSSKGAKGEVGMVVPAVGYRRQK